MPKIMPFLLPCIGALPLKNVNMQMASRIPMPKIMTNIRLFLVWNSIGREGIESVDADVAGRMSLAMRV